MSIFWNVAEIERLMRKHGIATQQEMNRRAGISRLTMYNISRAGALTRVDVPTLEAIARALDVNPLTLLRYEP